MKYIIIIFFAMLFLAIGFFLQALVCNGAVNFSSFTAINWMLQITWYLTLIFGGVWVGYETAKDNGY